MDQHQPPLDFDALNTLAELQHSLDKDPTSAVLASVAMGFDAVKSFLLMGASINKLVIPGPDFTDERSRA
jgi:hypothetical protein